jgi:hypothetical protein
VSERIAGVGLSDVYRDKEGLLWTVVGIAENPTVHLTCVGPFDRDLRQATFGPQDKHLVIGSLLYQELEHLVVTGPTPAKPA